MNPPPSSPLRGETLPLILSLGDPRSTDRAHAGGKASRLAFLRQAGQPVPDGFVIPTVSLADAIAGLGGEPTEAQVRASSLGKELERGIAQAFLALGTPVAVRSSGMAEDLGSASFAGQYETVLDVRDPGSVIAAVRSCLASACSQRVRTYLRERGISSQPMAVLIQRMVPARVSGVAFTVHPVTGERGVVVISAVAGLGESLVSGTSNAEEWEIRGDRTERRRVTLPLLTPGEALRVAELARQVSGDEPTDLEWGLDGDGLHLLQARPMTAVPDPVSWEVDSPVPYIRNFRLGEWIGAPLTPLTESWLVTEMEELAHGHFQKLFGLRPPRPLHILVNGWYFYGGLNYDLSLGAWLRCLPTTLKNLFSHYHEMMAVSATSLGFHQEAARWRETLLPPYQDQVRRWEGEVDSLEPSQWMELLRGVVEAAGVQLASIIGVAGYGAKSELALMEFLKTHAPEEQWSVYELVVGAGASPFPHDVEGLDWIFPTLGERGPLPPPPSEETRSRLLAHRQGVEDRVRQSLPRRRQGRFDHLLKEARIAHATRQEQTTAFTLGWPVMRRALRHLGRHLVEGHILSSAEDIVFLTRTELEAALGDLGVAPPVAARRRLWDRQRRLCPPLMVGQRTGLYKTIWDQVEALLHHQEHDAPDALRGMPGSPGRVSGPARVILGLNELDRLYPGEVLVAPITTPAWTSAFSRALAIVTDTGSIASHASIVAREHGIPAVVGTANGTARIMDGQRITVDGSVGVVRLQG